MSKEANHTIYEPERTPWGQVFLLVVIVGFVFITATACAPRMIEVDGHRVFNPEYLWYLESEDRDRWQKPGQVIESLELSEGDVIADIGAGGGYFTERFSKRVGKGGHVYAVDVQDIMITLLKNRVNREKLDNVTVIKGRFETPMLPSKSVDTAFFSSVYKEISERIEYMKEVRKSLKREGRVAILEFYKNGIFPGPEYGDRMYQSQVIEELEKAGFLLIQSFDFLPQEYFLVFGIKEDRTVRGPKIHRKSQLLE
ncbi:MAG: methyltransferase domain-containing protein [Deltaproteobacteria bacterium]|uniref:Methyltransferase domain-containing protein n=1 Tax=Candidatus Desulfacyla euxinica TaxID=2841693 RepID=A0A8J6N3V1_9DELT|nr:methyltransferase domain-containing protein [Candidatus Desulfacyla euxinica]MBL7217203.1 methyltransferase domain-containing protein [Desulfobacteraceae bacterium]